MQWYRMLKGIKETHKQLKSKSIIRCLYITNHDNHETFKRITKTTLMGIQILLVLSSHMAAPIQKARFDNIVNLAYMAYTVC